MLEKRKAVGANHGGGKNSAVNADNHRHPHYIMSRTKIQGLTGLIDLSLDRSDYHLGRAAELRRLIAYHEAQAAKHRAIRRSLENLIYPQVSRGL